MGYPWKTMIWSFVFAFIIEYGVCIVIAYFLWSDDPYPYKNAFWLMLGLWALQFSLGIKNLIVGTLQYHLFSKSKVADHITDMFFALDMPHDDVGKMDIDEYLQSVIYDEHSTREQVKSAAEWVGYIGGARSSGLVKGWRFTKMSNIGLQRYLTKRRALERVRERRDPAFEPRI